MDKTLGRRIVETCSECGTMLISAALCYVCGKSQHEENTMSVNMVVRVPVDGKQKNLSPEAAKARGLKEIFYTRWQENGKFNGKAWAQS